MHITGSATGEATYSRFQLPRRELPVALFTFHSIPHVRLIWLSVNCRRCPLWESWLGAGLIKASWNGLRDERIAHDTVHLSTRQDRNDEVVELSKPTDQQMKGMNDRKIFSIMYTKLGRKILCNLMKGTWSCGTLLQIKDESINSWGKRGGEIPQTACVSKYVVASRDYFGMSCWLFILRVTAIIMILTRQPLFKDACNFFRFRRWQLSFAYSIPHNHGEIMCIRSKSSKAAIKVRQTKAAAARLEHEDAASLDRQGLAPVCQ